MAYKFNPFTGNLDAVNQQIEFNDKFQFIYSSLSALDKIVDISYADSGLRYERITSIEYSSVDFPDANATKTITWLDAGTMNQRIEKEEWTGSIFSPYSLRKVYDYSASGITYRLDGFYFETF